MDPQQVDVEMRRAQAEFHQLISAASPDACGEPGIQLLNRASCKTRGQN